MMKKLMGLFATVALMGSGVAFADDQVKKQESEQTQSQEAKGGSGSMGTGSQVDQSSQGGMADQLSGNQLTGRVVKSERKMVWIEHGGAIVPLKIDKNTQFTDPSIKRPQDLKEGDEIRASFEVRKTDNVAKSIEKSTGAATGGSGTEVMSPDSSINQPSPLPSDKGTGGSGKDSDLSPPDTSGDY